MTIPIITRLTRLTERLAELREEERKHDDEAYMAAPYSTAYWSATVKAARVRGSMAEIRRLIDEEKGD